MTFLAVTTALWQGFQLSLTFFFVTLALAIPLGLIVSFGTMSKFWPLHWLCRIYVWIIRGTPLLLQVLIVRFAPSLLFGWDAPSHETAVIVAFVINYTAYFSEIFRGGIQSIPKGQYEAGYVLGLTKRQIFFKIILLQVIKNILPSMSNEIITLVKDTSLAQVIAAKEIIYRAMQFMAKALIWPLFYSGAYFLVFNTIVQFLLDRLEKKLSYFRI